MRTRTSTGTLLAVLLFGCGCGARTSLPAGEGPAALDGGPSDAEDQDADPPDADPPDADPPDAGGCACESGACLFRDGFEDGTAAWSLHPRWQESPSAQEGTASLRGFWQDFAVGCPVTAPATMAIDVSLAGVPAATLRYFQSGEACALDTLRILVSTDGGGSWSTAAMPAPLAAAWEPRAIDLGPWLGEPAARFGFEFDNVCGDACGVDWFVDDVSICAP